MIKREEYDEKMFENLMRVSGLKLNAFRLEKNSLNDFLEILYEQCDECSMMSHLIYNWSLCC